MKNPQHLNKAQELPSDSDYRILFEQSRDAITIVTTEGVFLDANPAFLKMSGFSKAELEGMNAADLWVHGEEREKWSRELSQNGFLVDYQSRQRTKDGKILDLLLTTTARRDNRHRIILQTILRDVTEKKRIEAEKERLIEELRGALDRVKKLEEFLPLCSHCRKIRRKGGSPERSSDWMNLETYLEAHTDSQVTHSICPDCLARYFPDFE